MALTTHQPTRSICYNGRELADFDPSLPVGEVVRMHSASEPALAGASVEGPVLSADGKTATYDVRTNIGHKG
jgi:PRTRC genetic system protein C